jgi:hypothetical protein
MKLNRLAVSVVAAIVAVAIVFSGCKSEQKAILSFAPKKGKKYEYVMNTVQDIEMEQMGQKMNSKNNIGFTYLMTVGDKDKDNNIAVVTTFRRIIFSTESPMGKMEYDSDNANAKEDPAMGMMTKAFGSLINKNITMMVNDKGEVVSLTGMEAIFTDMVKNMGLDSLPDAAAMLGQLKTQFSDDQFRKTFDEMFRILPGKSINIGESWDIETEKNLMNMGIKTKSTYTLKEMKDKNAVVSLSSVFDVTKSGAELQGGEMKMNGTQNGTITVDTETGFPIQSNITQDITTSSQIMGMEMPMKMKGVITITSKEIK